MEMKVVEVKFDLVRLRELHAVGVCLEVAAVVVARRGRGV